MKNRSNYIIFFLLLVTTSIHSQQAWPQKKGQGYFQVSTSFLNYSDLHIGNFELQKAPRKINQKIITSYNEYGITDKLTAILNIPYHQVSLGEYVANTSTAPTQGGKLDGLGNISLGLLYNFYAKNSKVISSKLNYGFNSSKETTNNGLATGERSYTLSPSFLFGIGKTNYFTSTEVGIELLNKFYSDRLIIHAQLGKKVLTNKKMILILGLISKFNLSITRKADESNHVMLAKRQTALYPAKQTYVALNFKMGYEFSKKLSIWGSASGGEGTNVGAGISYNLAIAYKLR